MEFGFLQAILDWVSQHPTWVGVIIFMIAMSESLAVLGLFIPGVVLLFGAGALVGAGVYPLFPSLAWAAAGAICGDVLSFFLGRYYKEHLRDIWPLSRYPKLMSRGEAYFLQHGGKSVFIGRFVGPIRPIIPAIAGMMGMTPARFVLINVVSAIAWAPAYILPGVVFGASLGLASQVATRLVVLVLLVVVCLGLIFWLSRRVYIYIAPRANHNIDRLLVWGVRHPMFKGVTEALADPAHPEARGLFLLAVLLIFLIWAFVALLVYLLGGHASNLDTAIWHIMQSLHTPWADSFMVLVSLLGGGAVCFLVAAAISLWMIWRRYWFALVHWCAAIAFGALVPQLLKISLQLPRPVTMYDGVMSYGFPSWHVTMNTVLYGFIAVIITREMALTRRWIVYAITSTWVVLIGLSRLYLGAHWFFDVIGGLMLGSMWVVLLGIAYRRHATGDFSFKPMLIITLLVLVIVGGWYSSHSFQKEAERYVVQRKQLQVEKQLWWQSDWQRLPAHRVDLEGDTEQALTIQWLATRDEVKSSMQLHGWDEPEVFDVKTALKWLIPDPDIRGLPVLPQVHDERHEGIRMVKDMGSRDRQLVLRLWRADLAIDDSDKSMWIGYVSYQHLVRAVPMLSLVETEEDITGAMEQFLPALDAWRIVVNEREFELPDTLSPLAGVWGKKVVLIMNNK